ncbi:type II toxin-antitoxin system MqsA family antitoxin [candidate division KSB1 bacterium]|nr:type II toxin-antitoxin system MqsA family antitoxin [candidate division KSB1 bacterium]
MKAKYDTCDYCGGRVFEKRVTVDLRLKGKLYVFENVPVGVCRKCGERYYRGPVLERLEELAAHQNFFKDKIQVPRFDFAEAAVF